MISALLAIILAPSTQKPTARGVEAQIPKKWNDMTPIWVTPGKMLYRIGDNSTEEEYIAEFRTGQVTPIRSIRIDWMPNFVRMIGNPELGDFAIIECGSGRFEIMRGPFTKDLRKLKTPRIIWISDIGPNEILAEQGTEDSGGYYHLKRVLCLRQKDGSTMWGARCDTDNVINRAARWSGPNVVVGDSVLDGKTGHKVAPATRSRRGALAHQVRK